MCAKKLNSQEIYLQLLEQLNSKNVKPIYYLFGDEEFYLDSLQDRFTNLIPEFERDFNYDLLYGQDISIGRLLGIVKSYPMMAEKRMVIVRNFLQIDKNDKDMENFIHYLEHPNPTCILVMLDSSKPAGNTKLGRALNKSAKVQVSEFSQLPDYLVPNWIRGWIKSSTSKEIDLPAAQLLAQYVGNNLQLLTVEIDKVVTYIDKSTSITVEDVQKVIGLYREYTAFDLRDAIFERDLNKTLYISEKILQHTKSEAGEIIQLVAFLNSSFTTIWQILRLAQKGLNKSQIKSKMGIGNNWYFNKLWKDASKYRHHEMPKIFEALLDADRAIKGFSTLDNTSILFFMVQRIIV